MAEEYTKNQLNYRRSKGVSKAWARERELVSKGRGTRNWSVAEQKELLRTGRVKGYQGHHMKSVSKHPDYAANPKNIQFLDARKGNNEHLKAHRGDYRNESDSRYSVRTGSIRPMGEGKPRAMNSYELKDKAIEKRGYTKYSAVKEAGRSKAAEKGTAKQATAFNGKSYQRSMVKQPGKKGSERSRTAEKAKDAAKTFAKPKAPERARSSSSGKSPRYGEKAAARSRGSSAGKSSGSYGKARSSSTSRSGSSGYGKGASRGSSGASKGGASHGAGKGR